MISDLLGKELPVWQEYPRMQLQRDYYLNLNGTFDYQITDGSFPEAHAWKQIQVPFALGTPLSKTRDTYEIGQLLWYRRKFHFDPVEGFAILNFEAVDQCCEVYLNGVFIGSHEGGYAPFSFDVTKWIEEENELLVKVIDDCDTSHYAYGKQKIEKGETFYTPVVGIWQSVWLEVIPQSAVLDLKITPDFDASSVYLTFAGNFQQAVITVFENKKLIHRGITNLKEYTITLDEIHPWTCDDPFLYDLYIQTEDETVKSYFAMRKFSYEKDLQGHTRFCLNNQPMFLTGVLDQGYNQQGGYTYESYQAMVKQLQLVKEMGFNMIRKHAKQECRLFYYVCDRLGILVMQDMVNGGNTLPPLRTSKFQLFSKRSIDDTDYEKTGRKDEASRDMYYKELDAMLNTLYNHPCIFAWCCFHEGWGQFDSQSVLNHVKDYDTTRLVDVSSGIDQKIGDFQSVHSLGKHIHLPKSDSRILFLSDFGGYSYVEEGHFGSLSPYGSKIYLDKKELNEAIFDLYQKQIDPSIRKGLSGCVYRQLSDVEQECNGLITYDQELIKVDMVKLKRLNDRCKRRIK